MDLRPFRSVLYIPGSKERALDKARDLPADALILDLEDAVAPAEKPAARQLLAQMLRPDTFGRRAVMVRINDLGTDWGTDDVATLAAARPEALLLPKVNDAEDIAALARLMDRHPGLSDTRIWAMMETPPGVLNAAQIARAPRMAGFIMGTNDLAKDLRCTPGDDRLALQMALQTCLLAARAADIVAVDGVYNAFRDETGLRAECEQGRDLGFDGKTLIHPAQLDIANAVFAPDPASLDLARRQIAAYDDAIALGQAVAVVDGRIVENLHVHTARQLLARAEAIAALQGGN